jgi:hypothetical protein
MPPTSQAFHLGRSFLSIKEQNIHSEGWGFLGWHFIWFWAMGTCNERMSD